MQLQDPTWWQIFQTNLKTCSKQLPGTMANFEQFLKDWQASLPLREKILAGNAEAVGKIKASLLKGKSPQQFFAKADDATVAQLAAVGFRMPRAPHDVLPILREEAQADLDIKKIAESSLSPPANMAAQINPAKAAAERGGPRRR